VFVPPEKYGQQPRRKPGGQRMTLRLRLERGSGPAGAEPGGPTGGPGGGIVVNGIGEGGPGGGLQGGSIIMGGRIGL